MSGNEKIHKHKHHLGNRLWPVHWSSRGMASSGPSLLSEGVSAAVDYRRNSSHGWVDSSGTPPSVPENWIKPGLSQACLACDS